MAQIFHRSANVIARVSLWGFLILVGLIGKAAWDLVNSPYTTQVDMARSQPVQFSHKHHVQGAGIDCRYCHTSVETSAFAGIPPTKTCMNCHSTIWSDSPMLEPVRESLKNNTPIAWTRVHDLPDFAYFNHSIHISKGIGCETCHGRVDQMPITHKEKTLQMSWCLDCHTNPAKYIRPKEEVTTMGWKPPVDQSVLGPQLVKEYNVKKYTSCSTCHR
jgi:hypothetical protein